MLAAFIVAATSEGRTGLRKLWSRMIRWRVGPIWWLVALSPLVIGLLMIVVLRIAQGHWITFADLGRVQFLPPLGIGALLLWILTFGIGEETGWRGYALPRLQRNRSALAATAILTVLWILWHLPGFFYVFDRTIALGWAIGLFAGAIVLTWLFNSSGGSVLLVAIWHGGFNFISASSAGDGLLAMAITILVMIWAVFVVVLFKPKDLSRAARIVD